MKLKSLCVLVLATGILALVGCQKGGGLPSSNAKLDSDDAKFSYAIGYEMGKNMGRRKVKMDYNAFVTAMADALEGRTEQLSDTERREVITAVSKKQRQNEEAESSKNLTDGKAFLEKNKSREGVQMTASGLQYEVLNPGPGGPKPKLEDSVEAHYKGTLIDGTVFDSSYERKKPAEFPLRGVIPGWREALQLMEVGSKYKLYIPPDMGYGSHGNAKIPGNSVLIFEVELLNIKPKKSKETGKKNKETGKKDKNKKKPQK